LVLEPSGIKSRIHPFFKTGDMVSLCPFQVTPHFSDCWRLKLAVKIFSFSFIFEDRSASSKLNASGLTGLDVGFRLD